MRSTGPGVSGDMFEWRDRRPRMGRNGRVARKESQPSEQWQGSLLFSSVREPRLGEEPDRPEEKREYCCTSVQTYWRGNKRENGGDGLEWTSPRKWQTLF
jgi:hypothetical protein